MARLRRTVCAALAALGILWGGAGGAQAAQPPGVRCAPAARPKATVLLLHAGGWVLGNAAMMESECKAFARHGFEALSVEYPLKDFFGSLRVAERAAAWRRRQPVYAVGWSAGGNLAAMLAARGEVTGAVAVAAPTNLLTWQDDSYWHDLVPLTRRQRREASPVYCYRRSRTRLLLMHSRDDTVVPYRQSVDLARRAHARLVTLSGDHLADHSALRRSIRWVERDFASR